MDRFSVSSHANDSNNSNNSTFFSELIGLRFSNSLRNISSTDRQYTYRHTNGSTLSRIDYIWVSDIQDVICRKYESVDITDITYSDHNLVLTELYLGDFLSINHRRTHINLYTQLEDQYYSQMIIKKDKITNETWINFQHYNISPDSKARKHTAKLRVLIHKVSNLNHHELAQFIDNHTSLIIPTQDILSQSWTQVLHSIVKVRTYIDHKIRRSHNLKIISERVERLFEITQSNQSEWLSKIQNKTSRRIIINRIKVELANGSCYMELHPANIKTLTKEKLEHIVRARNTTWDSLDQKWQNIYKPANTWNRQMEVLNSPVQLDEWMSTLKEMNTSSTSGPSGISYSIIKHLPDIAHNTIINFINLSVQIGIVPSQWRLSTICPIPKPEGFNCDLNNIRPIAWIT
ncbi:hypothetical protein RclHR1_08700015 [Rhizophagus clarus]|uniref:L1Tco protein n=1 Tax=Rhizophagus clarus TaxID=94130 RepID=A0A2Z6SNT7_9GLOM|nr:hypothetical protein RclHR1_08700015 [Rhizophagus clarus]GET01211.1 L1Tco protein [Rhizophagus clarus]